MLIGYHSVNSNTMIIATACRFAHDDNELDGIDALVAANTAPILGGGGDGINRMRLFRGLLRCQRRRDLIERVR